jgi:hypothetical protein
MIEQIKENGFVPNWTKKFKKIEDAYAYLLMIIADLPGTFYFQGLMIENQEKNKD